MNVQNFKLHKSVVLFFAFVFILSCSPDEKDETISGNDLIGEWQRSDFSNEFEYRLIFNPNTGYEIQTEGDIAGGTAISSLVTFDWTTTNAVLTMDFDGEIITTTFAINAEGKLFLNDITNLHFIKINE